MKNFLLIKMDHIGDYIVMRNLLREIKNSKKYFDYKLTFVLNDRLKDFVEFLDEDVVDEFIYVDMAKYIQSNWYTKRIDQRIKQNNYDTLLNAMFFRAHAIEHLVSSIKSEEKIILKEMAYDKSSVFESNYDENYSKVIDLTTKKDFEFDKFKFAFENILDKQINILKPYIKVKKSWQLDLDFNFEYIVIFIGSDSEYRKWSIYKYVDVINFIIANTSLHVILCAGNSEEDDAVQIQNLVQNDRLHNLVAQTTLIDMLAIISGSKLVISNETGIAHMSMALETYTVVISNANHFGKFTPYPKNYTDKYFSIYPFKVDENNFKYYKNIYYNGSKLDINSIELEDVIDVVKKVLSLLKINLRHKKVIKSKINLLSPTQLQLNYTFSSMFSKSLKQIVELKNTHEKILVYGNGSFGNVVKNTLDTSCVGIIENETLKNIDSFDFDKLIITVLGRENDIEKTLVEKYNIPSKKIIKINITKSKYVIC